VSAAHLVARRDLLLNLMRTEVSARYRSTALGFAWFVLTPLSMMVVLTIVFEYVVDLGIPSYPVFVLSGLLPWTFIQVALLNATTSVTRSSGLIKRAPMPRVFLPLAAVGSNVLHYFVSLALLAVLMLIFGVAFQPSLVLLPLVVAVTIVAVTGLGLITSAINVAHRDVEMLTSAALRVLFYASPVIYPLSAVPAEWRTLYLLNPAAGIIEMHRSVIVYGTLPPLDVMVITGLSTTVLTVAGVLIFRRAQRDFEDYV
jgi:ABC-type polysaccharide/polyol phosphate export permease